jgi:hypothetical protein
MEGKRFSADVKCENRVMIQFDGPIIFVSNVHLHGDVCFLEELILFVLRELRQTILCRFAYVSQKKRVMGLQWQG